MCRLHLRLWPDAFVLVHHEDVLKPSQEMNSYQKTLPKQASTEGKRGRKSLYSQVGQRAFHEGYDLGIGLASQGRAA